MPSKNTVKNYVKDGIYHIYNRGVEKRDIFMDDQDYKAFLNILKRYLSSPEQLKLNQVGPGNQVRPGRQTELYKNIRLLCYCLMPNHFHLMVKQLTERAMTDLMRRLTNSYTRYFNKKYERVGSLFQGRYKAALITKEVYFLHLPYYIHYNPTGLFNSEDNIEEKVENYPWSSLGDYLGNRNTNWLYTEGLMEQFIETQKQGADFENSKNILGDLALEK